MLAPLLVVAFAAGIYASPAMFCFIKPEQRESFDPSVLRNLSCTHYVYGDVSIDAYDGKPAFGHSDVMYAGEPGNIRHFLRLRLSHPKAKFLLGVRRSSSFSDSKEAYRVAHQVATTAEDRKFDGVFVNFDDLHLEQRSAVDFMKKLSQSKKLSSPTLSVTAVQVWSGEAIDRIRDIVPYVDYVYLDMAQIPSAKDKYVIAHVDVLEPTHDVRRDDTIKGTVQKLQEGGVLPGQIIVGFTAGGWKLKVANVMKAVHGEFAQEKRIRVKQHEVCRLRGTQMFDPRVLNDVTMYRQTWTSANSPTPAGLGKKMSWVLTEGLGGLGVSSIQDDDPRAFCSFEPFPVHRIALQTILQTVPAEKAKCTRICYFDAEKTEEDFPFADIPAHWCSHVIISPINIDIYDNAIASQSVKSLLPRVREWLAKFGDASPQLVFSVGGRQKNDVWSFMIHNAGKRTSFVKNLLQLVNSENATGIELNWTLEPLLSNVDKLAVVGLVEDIRKASKNMTIILAASPESTIADRYDVARLSQLVDLVTLQTDRLHESSQTSTSVRSPLRSTADPSRSVENITKRWIEGGVRRKKLVVTLSAESIAVRTIGVVNMDTPLGRPAFNDPSGVRSQEEVCASGREKSTGEFGWEENSKSPFLIRDGKFIAFENRRSARVKTTWTSMEGMGMALRSVEADDPRAACGSNQSFPILRTIVEAQVCPRCLPRHNFNKCDHDFSIACNFDLKKYTPALKVASLPHELCTEVVVDHIALDKNGHVQVGDKHQNDVIDELARLRPKMVKCGMVASLKCEASEREINKLLLENSTVVVDNIVTFLREKGFSGVQLDCENVVTTANHRQFSAFMRDLQRQMGVQPASSGCPFTLAIKLSQKTRSLPSYYQMSLLNQVHHVVLAATPAPVVANKSTSLEATLEAWKKSGLKTSKLVVELSSQFEYTNSSKKTSHEYTKEMCDALLNRDVQYLSLDDLRARVPLDKYGFVNMQTVDTLHYKIGLALRDELGGVAIRNVNHDDHIGACGVGSFPSLKSLYKTPKCF